MRTIAIVALITLSVLKAQSQISSSNQWTWIGGSNGYNASGVYGQKGVESSANQPGGRFDFASWKDRNGNFWIFGGYGRGSSSAPGWLNDLWRFNPNNNRWTWVAGDSVINRPAFQSGLGVESSNNTPSARSAVSGWESADGRELYLYGGATNTDGGLDEINGDVWAYNIESAKWRIIKYAISDALGNCSGQDYVSPLCNSNFAPGVWPTCREAAAVSASNGAAFIFGGQVGAYTNSEFFRFSDYNFDVGSSSCPTKNQWASIQFGAPYLNGSPGYYSGHAPHPGSRRDASSFAESGLSVSQDKFYLFGGAGMGALVNGTSNYGILNDLWRFDGQDPVTRRPVWTWLKGDSTINRAGNYGTKGVAAASNNPSSRYRSSMENAGRNQAILFGGAGYSSSGFGALNDLWSYDPKSNMWTWLSGSSMASHSGSYGIQGIQSSSNLIPAREGAAMDSAPAFTHCR